MAAFSKHSHGLNQTVLYILIYRKEIAAGDPNIQHIRGLCYGIRESVRSTEVPELIREYQRGLTGRLRQHYEVMFCIFSGSCFFSDFVSSKVEFLKPDDNT